MKRLSHQKQAPLKKTQPGRTPGHPSLEECLFEPLQKNKRIVMYNSMDMWTQHLVQCYAMGAMDSNLMVRMLLESGPAYGGIDAETANHVRLIMLLEVAHAIKGDATLYDVGSDLLEDRDSTLMIMRSQALLAINRIDTGGFYDTLLGMKQPEMRERLAALLSGEESERSARDIVSLVTTGLTIAGTAALIGLIADNTARIFESIGAGGILALVGAIGCVVALKISSFMAGNRKYTGDLDDRLRALRDEFYPPEPPESV